MEQEISQLENRVASLTNYFDGLKEERLKFPLDLKSRKTLDYWQNGFFTGLFISTGRIFPSYFDVLTDLLAVGVEVRINGQKRVLLTTFKIQAFTVNAGSDVLTNTAGSHNLNNNDLIALTTTNTLPAPFVTFDAYYVVNRTGTTFQLSATKGGAPIDITDAGIGTHYYGLI